MAKPKKIAAKSKAKTNKYTKLMAAASKELADKKKFLVKAEKTLAKATKAHSELLAEVARLDMLERSLKALVEGTEPPQNVKYTYTYPQWVWYYPSQWWYPCQPNTGYYYPWTVTLNTGGTNYNGITTNTLQGTSGQYSLGNLGSSGTFQTSGLCTTTATNTVDIGTLTTNTTPCGTDQVVANSSGVNCWTTTTAQAQADLVIDLSTGASEEEPIAVGYGG